ncbi:SRPBCC family protein [Candidatus Obscuribacterales bacterium]|jgi:hypothetical protein|nr:SRPBCC family protein [Candidatus Obscuribacterales bacterium]
MNAKSTLMLGAVAAIAMQLPAHASVVVEDSIVVNAKPEAVWKALREYQREEKAFHKKVVSSTSNSVSLKEEFARLPVVGTMMLSYIEVNKPEENRVDYRLTEKGTLNKFEGSWIIEENKTTGGVTLKLVTEIDSWVPAPFKNHVLRSNTKKGMEKRLEFVKEYAENLSGANKVSADPSKRSG